MTVPASLFAGARAAPWIPETAMRLAAAKWTRVNRAFGLDQNSYGTARFRGRSRSASRNVAGDVVLPAGCGHRAAVVIELLDPTAAAPYIAMGLEFASAAEVKLMDASSRLAAALAILSPVPELLRTMGALLGAIHILKPPGADYDVSHSDPDVPFSVFIGVSPDSSPLDRLRLSEALVHECMHLLLTLLEAERPLVRGHGELHHSPWKGRSRPTQGVLHGFYVFASLDVLFARLAAANQLDKSELAHLRLRRWAIAAELDIVANALATSRELTEDGRSLVEKLRSGDGRETLNSHSP